MASSIPSTSLLCLEVFTETPNIMPTGSGVVEDDCEERRFPNNIKTRENGDRFPVAFLQINNSTKLGVSGRRFPVCKMF